uniref:Uncharacterized protein n=1 Tax=Oryza punctata TaxID=4537 RepID=A0A0E0JGA8_ORYPU
MANPVVPCPSAAYGPGGCDGVGCSSSHNVWAHRVHHNGGVYRLCSSCVLLSHRNSFCSVCLDVFPDTAFQDDFYNPIVSCSCCGVEPVAVAHLACLPDPSYFVCPACAAAAEGRAFSYATSSGAPHALAERVLLVAARLAHESVARAAAAAREQAERLIREAAAARKRARDMVDVACRVLEAEARDAKEQATAPPSPVPVPASEHTPSNPVLIKKTPKSSAANRSSDKPLKINSIQKPALAFAAAAAAAAAASASSTPLSTPSPAEERKPMKQGRGSANRGAKDDQRALFGAFQP